MASEQKRFNLCCKLMQEGSEHLKTENLQLPGRPNKWGCPGSRTYADPPFDKNQFISFFRQGCGPGGCPPSLSLSLSLSLSSSSTQTKEQPALPLARERAL